jgi:glycosyltransferase involved in cell wall biosynthesis
MARGLMANGAELHLLTINTKKHFKPDENVPEVFRKASHYRSVYRNTDTSALGALVNLFSSESYFVSRFHFEEFGSAIVSKLKEHEFDIVQLEGLFVGVYLPLIRKHSKAKVVLRAHNIEHLIWQRHIANERSAIKKKYLQLQNKRLKDFEWKIIREVDAIVCITDADKEFIRNMGVQKPLYTCITGVDAAEYQLKDKVQPAEKTIFSFASMDWIPNQEAVDWFLENCWQQVKSKVPDCKLVIAGRYMPERFLKLNLPGVEVIENVGSSRDFYSSQGIMLVPLLSGSGLRIKIIEGMAYGKAIVSTSIGAEGINIENGKNILIADKAAEFADKVVFLLEHPGERRKLEQEAAKFATENFDNSKVGAGLVKFYRSLNA